jgi:TRAP transporter TAXI family solute receptor
MKPRGCNDQRIKKGNLLFSIFLFSSVVLFWLFYPATGWAQTKSTVRLSIAAGGTGGVYYVIGGGIAALVSKYVPGIEVTAEVTAAGIDNIKLIMARKADLALVQTDYGYEAYAGTVRFKSTGKVPLRTLAVLYPAVSQIVTVEGTGINTVMDLKGKRVSTGAAGSGSEAVAFKIFEAVGLDPNKDIRRERLSVAESAGAVKDRKIQAFFFCAGLPTAAVLDLASSPGFKIKLIAHDDLLEKINNKYGPFYYRLVIPQETYPGMTHPVPVIATGNALVCHEQLEESIAYRIVKAILEHREELKAVHKEAEKFTLENAVTGCAIPFHPGAVKYYKEMKVWRE